MPAIEVKNISKSFGSKIAVNNVSFSVDQGKIIGFLGPNGAGKTTTIRLLMDFIRPDNGSITIFNSNAKEDSAKLKNIIGYSSSELELYKDWTGKQHLRFFQNIKGKTTWATEIAKRFDLDLNIKVKKLSSGNKQKLALILAFINNPKLLIMDEPTNGLDPLLQMEFYKVLKEYQNQGGTVFLSSHNLDEVQRICNAVMIIREGKIIALKSMDEIREMGVHMIKIITTSKLNISDFKIKELAIISHNHNEAILKVHGDINKVMKIIYRYQLKDLEITHLNLEEIFAELYL